MTARILGILWSQNKNNHHSWWWLLRSDDDQFSALSECQPVGLSMTATEVSRSHTFLFSSIQITCRFITARIIISQVHARETKSLEYPLSRLLVSLLSPPPNKLLGDQSKRQRESGLDYGPTLTDWLLIFGFVEWWSVAPRSFVGGKSRWYWSCQCVVVLFSSAAVVALVSVFEENNFIFDTFFAICTANKRFSMILLCCCCSLVRSVYLSTCCLWLQLAVW